MGKTGRFLGMTTVKSSLTLSHPFPGVSYGVCSVTVLQGVFVQTESVLHGLPFEPGPCLITIHGSFPGPVSPVTSTYVIGSPSEPVFLGLRMPVALLQSISSAQSRELIGRESTGGRSERPTLRGHRVGVSEAGRGGRTGRALVGNGSARGTEDCARLPASREGAAKGRTAETDALEAGASWGTWVVLRARAWLDPRDVSKGKSSRRRRSLGSRARASFLTPPARKGWRVPAGVGRDRALVRVGQGLRS